MNDVAAVIIVVVGIVPVIVGSKAESHEYMPVKPVVKSMVKSTIVKVAASKTAMKSTAVESSAGEAAVKASSGEAAVTTTAEAAVTTATTAAVTTAAATAAAGHRGGRLRQAQSCHREQRNNRFPHHGSLLLWEDVAPKCINVSAARLFEDAAVN